MKRVDVVTAIIIEHGRILLTQRSPNGSFPWLFETPGGKVDDGEGFDEALRRELDEELGIAAHVQQSGPFPIRYVDIDPPICKGPRRVHFMRASILVGTPRPRVAAGLAWWTADDLAWLRMTPANEARREELVKLVRGAER